MAEPQQDQCKAHDVVSGAFAGVQQGQLPKFFSAKLTMLAQACIRVMNMGSA